MSFSHVVKQSVATGGVSVETSNTYTASSRVSVNESVPDASTDLEITVAIDVSAVKSFYLKSDVDVTVETNSGSTPDDTLNLTANDPYVWNTGSLDSFLLGTDVASLFITNSSGSAATIELEALVDPTP